MQGVNIEPVGLAEISELLGVPPNTVTSWRHRDVLPRPRWELKAGPIWDAGDLRKWYEREKGSAAAIPPPDRAPETIDLTNESGRAEVFAHYGLAMAEAQMVEQHLAAVLVLLGVPNPYSRAEFLRIIELAEGDTMGRLKDRLRKMGAPVLGIEHLERVVATRNLLAHAFFRDAERSVKMTHEAGRAELIAELDDAARRFWTTAHYLRAAEVRLAMRYGVSKDIVMERVRQIQGGQGENDSVGRRARVLLSQAPGVDDTIDEAFASSAPRKGRKKAQIE
jgi:hypothetical protein